MDRKAFVLLGLGFGDEGKGSVTDYIVRSQQAHTVVRFNGGSQAAHHVTTPEQQLHCFAQFGSGSFVSGVKTYLSRFMLIDPIGMELEAEHLKSKGIKNIFQRTFINRECLVVTPFQKIINRMLELSRKSHRHGSCGMGVGQTITDANYLKDRALFASDIEDRTLLRKKLDFIWRLKLDLAEQLSATEPENETLAGYFYQISQKDLVEKIVDRYVSISNRMQLVDEKFQKTLFEASGAIVFEGAQGLLLDPEYGFQPHVTKTRTTFHNADLLLENYSGEVKRMGVLRSYHTRHGAGPFVTEDLELTDKIPDEHNSRNDWQQDFRVGWFDLVAARYSLTIAKGLDSIALTNLDRLFSVDEIKLCTGYKVAPSDLFLFGDGLVATEIKITSPYQTRLTQLLFEAKPVYENIKDLERKNLLSFIHDYVHLIKNRLKVPIEVVSFGKTFEEKLSSL